uniref:Uncharacterized protein n=1 Tax=Magallana gigas TaxID=29159 RepID=A0A8W8L2R4_MAGGI
MTLSPMCGDCTVKRRRLDKLSPLEHESCREVIESLTSENAKLKEDIDTLQTEKEKTEMNDVCEERDWLAEITGRVKDTVSFFDEQEKKYSVELRNCIYSLLQLHVSSQVCSQVIESVLSLVNIKANKLPSASTVQNMNIERLVLAQKQLSESLPNTENLTIYTDETTKYGTKFGGYHLSDSEGRMYVLGLRQLLTKSGRDTLAVFQDILQDIDDRSEKTDLASKKILLKITATMSDRASTELKFNELLEKFRADVLPELMTNWNELSDEDQRSASSLLNFFCGLHSLVHFAEACNISLAEAEKGFFEDSPPIFDKSFLQLKEAGTTRLIRTACKALSRGGDEKSGRFRDFSNFIDEFLRQNSLQTNPLQPFHGNRFNVLFESSSAVFFLHEKIQEFLEGNKDNKLLRAVAHDISVPEYVAGAKALGLISRHITGPLWSLLENKSIHILEMNENYLQSVNFVLDPSQSIEAVMTGDPLVFGNRTIVKRDAIYDSLIQPWDHDDKVVVYLSILLPVIGEVAKRLFKDHLPGGCWENVTEDMKEKSRGTSKHNKFAESVFGYLDQLMRKNPNMSILASEAYIMFTSNKTKQWLDAKSEEEKKYLVEDAMKENGKIKQCSIEQLAANLKKLVSHAYTIQVTESDQEHNPILVGKHVQHKFVDSDACEKWWTGKVVSQVPGYPAWYNIVYDGDIAVYTYQLLEDLKNGNLKITVLKQ